MNQKAPIKEPKKKEEPKKEEPKQLASKAESAQPAEAQPEAPKPMTQADMQAVIEALSKTAVEHTEQISELQEALARKRKAVPNGKIQIRDKTTGKVYPSKNNTYQSLLKAGDLQALVDKGTFGPDPAKNNFGWFALQRAWPDRFEEIKPEQKEEVKPEQTKEQT